MRDIRLTEDEVKTLFRAIFQQTSMLEEKLKESQGTFAGYIRGQIKDLDNVSKRIMHAGVRQIKENGTRDADVY